MNFERKSDPKRTLRIGKKSNLIFDQIEAIALDYRCVRVDMLEKYQQLIDQYTRVPPEISEILVVWETISPRKKTKEIFVFYEEVMNEENKYGMNLPIGTIFPWIFNISYKEKTGIFDVASRIRAEDYLEITTWHLQIQY